MSIQTIEIHGERFVILSERDFLAIQSLKDPMSSVEPQLSGNHQARFREVEPLKLEGTPASELLLQDRR